MKIKFIFNRKNKLNKHGLSSIEVRVYVKGDYAKFLSTGIDIAPNNWDESTQSVKNHTHALEYNTILSKIREKAQSFYNQKYISQEKCSANEVVNFLKGGDSLDSFSDFIKKDLQTTDLAKGTVEKYNLLVKYLDEFRPNLTFSKVNYAFVKDFERFLLSKKKSNGGLFSRNYVSSLLICLRKSINEAIREDKIKDNPFKKFRIKTTKKVPVYLTEEEILKISSFESLSDYEKRHRDAFVWGCYVGLRLGDLKKANSEMVKDNWLRIQPKKTKNSSGVWVDLPLDKLFDGKPLEMIQDRVGVLWPKLDNTQMNKMIKNVCKELEIDKHVSAHTARHSFAVNLLIRGNNLKLVSKLLGHSSIVTTEVYGQIVEQTLLNNLK